MPPITIYLNQALADAVKLHSIPVSTVCQQALRQRVRRLEAAQQKRGA